MPQKIYPICTQEVTTHEKLQCFELAHHRKFPDPSSDLHSIAHGEKITRSFVQSASIHNAKFVFLFSKSKNINKSRHWPKDVETLGILRYILRRSSKFLLQSSTSKTKLPIFGENKALR